MKNLFVGIISKRSRLEKCTPEKITPRKIAPPLEKLFY